MKLINKLKNNKALLAFLLSLLLGCLIVLPNVIINKGIYSLIADLNYQQIPFNKMINYSLKNGEFLWTWYNDLGSNFIGTFSFYNLFSPFNLLTYIFPESILEYLIGPIYILKYAVSGLTSYLFLKRYVKNKNYCLIGSLLYTFSGFQLTNILFFHFHDVVAFFPLLLYTLDNLIYDNKKIWFSLSLALCAFTNWFFFIGECVFLVIYFLVKIFTKEYKITKEKFITLILEGILGCTLAALVLIPSALFIMGNTRLNNNWTLINMLKYFNSNFYLEIGKSFLFPNDVMNLKSTLEICNYGSIEIYLPVIGSVLALSYFFKNKKKWESILMLILCILMVVPILNSSFILFQATYYARWFFMPSLILVLLSIKCLEKNENIKTGLTLSILGIIFFFINILIKSYRGQVIFEKEYFIIEIIFTIINLIITYLIMKMKNKTKLLIISIFIFITIWGNINVFYYKEKSIKTNEYYYEYLNSNEIIELPDQNARYNSNGCEVNYSYLLKNNNIRTFNSNINGSSFEFYNSLNIERSINTEIPINNKKLNDILGVKYILSCNDDDLTTLGYEFIKENGKYKIYKNNEYKEFGFSLNDYINIEEFNKLTDTEKIEILYTKVVLTNDQVEKYKHLFNKNTSFTSNEFKFTKNGFSSKINSNGETLAIYQIPYDKGWTATLNGKKIEIEKVDNGFIGIKLSNGINDIEFKYFTPGLKLGLILSSLSLITLIFYMIYNRKNNKEVNI